MFPAPFLQVFLRWQHQSAVWSSSLYYVPQASVSGVDPGGDMAAIADDAHAQLAGAAANVMHDSSKMTSTQVKLLKSTSVMLDATTTEADIDGQVTDSSGGVLPDEDAVVIQRLSGFVGPKNRGRIYCPFVPEFFQDSGTLTTTGMTAYRTFAGVLKTPQTFGGIIYNPVTPNHKDNNLLTISETRVQTQIHSQRRRRHPKRSIAIPSP